MADVSDDPTTWSAYYRAARGRLRLRVRLALHGAAAASTDYPLPKLVVNRVVNLGIRLLFGHGYNDTTNAFKAYRREVIDNVQPLLSHHFNLTVEIPLKAVVRGHSYAIVPIRWRNRTAGESKLKLQEMGSRYLFIVLLRVPRAPPQPRRLPPPGPAGAAVGRALACGLALGAGHDGPGAAGERQAPRLRGAGRYPRAVSGMAVHGRLSAADVGALVGVSGTTIGQWARRGYIDSSQRAREPRVYAVEDVVEAAIVRTLIDRGMRRPDVRRTVARLREGGPPWPLSRMRLGTVSEAAGRACSSHADGGWQELTPRGWQRVVALWRVEEVPLRLAAQAPADG